MCKQQLKLAASTAAAIAYSAASFAAQRFDTSNRQRCGRRLRVSGLAICLTGYGARTNLAAAAAPDCSADCAVAAASSNAGRWHASRCDFAKRNAQCHSRYCSRSRGGHARARPSSSTIFFSF